MYFNGVISTLMLVTLVVGLALVPAAFFPNKCQRWH